MYHFPHDMYFFYAPVLWKNFEPLCALTVAGEQSWRASELLSFFLSHFFFHYFFLVYSLFIVVVTQLDFLYGFEYRGCRFFLSQAITQTFMRSNCFIFFFLIFSLKACAANLNRENYL